MLSQNKWIRFFLAELPELQSSGVIDAAACERLRAHYQSKLEGQRESRQRLFQLSLAILGVVLIGGGVILLFNYNWDMLPKAVRILVAALPLEVGAALSLYTLFREKSAVWQEASAILTAVGGAVFIALLSHIYQRNGSFFNYLSLVLATSLPLIFLFDSKGLAIIYEIALCGLWPEWHGHFQGNVLAIQAVLALAFCTWVVWKLFRGAPAAKVLARYLVIGLVGFHFAIIASRDVFPPLGYYLLVGCAFSLLAFRLGEEGEWNLRNPWGTAAFLLELGALVYAACRDGYGLLESSWLEIHEYWRPVQGMAFGLMILCLVALVGLTGWQLFQARKNHTLHFEKVMLAVLAALPFLLDLVAEVAEGPAWLAATCFFPLATLAWGVARLHRGIQLQRVGLFNSGLLVIVAFMTCRFAAEDFGLLIRAAGFIVMGVLFLVANVVFTRVRRRAKTSEAVSAREVEQ